MTGWQEHPAAPGRRTSSRTAARWLTLALASATLTVCVGGGLAIATPEASPQGAGGTTSPATEPPTAAEARAWEAEFLAQEDGSEDAAPTAKSGKRAPGGPLFPSRKVLSLYGAAGGFGIIGRKSLNGAAEKLNKQVRPYRKRSNEPVVKAFDLVAVIATKCSGSNDKCRNRVSKETIQRYLRKIRELNGRLILDIQPGRSNVLEEIKHLKGFIRKGNVDVALDAEWNVGPKGEPGEDLGSLKARRINGATKKLLKIIRNRDLPPKLLIVHQFRRDSVRGEKNIKRPGKVDVTLNFDGIGSRSAKTAGYKDLSFPGLFNGFSLFYELDDGLMSPRQVLSLRPQPDYIMYQ